MRFEDYAIEVTPLPPDEGGGYLVTMPDLPGCVADGATLEEAISEARDAFLAWSMAEMEDRGKLPQPDTYSGRFLQRVPQALHMRLAQRAAVEGVSVSQLAAACLAEGLAARTSESAAKA